jgi:hypothetical protein
MITVGLLSKATAGIDYYRAKGPLNHLELTGQINLKLINDASQLLSISLLYAVRAYQEPDLNIIYKAKRLGIPVIWDVDDDLLNLPLQHPSFPYYNQKSVQDRIKEAFNLADLIITSTESLRESIFKLVGPKVEVINNAIDERFLKFKHNTEPNVTWRGGETHDLDLRSVSLSLIEVVNKYELPLKIWGWYPWFLMGQVSKIEYRGPEDFITYFLNFRDSDAYISIVPLVNHQFNRSKSNIAWLEATMAGAACLASGLPEFNNFGVRTFDNQSSFKNELTLLVTQPELVREAYLNSFECISNNYTLQKTNKQRIQIMRGL